MQKALPQVSKRGTSTLPRTTLLVIVGALLSAVVSTAMIDGAEAQRRRGRPARGRTAPVADAPQSAAVSSAMGDLQWGATRADLITAMEAKIEERYRPKITKARDAIEEDRFRSDLTNEIRRTRDSQVCFTGRRTGWDVSFLRDEFTHNNQECMIVVNDETSQNFYFFIQNRLWKWYKAFNASVFAGRTFEEFAATLQAPERFGTARENSGELVTGAGERRWLEWQDANTRLRAIDQTRFYGFYCLVFEEKQTVASLASLRRNVGQNRNQGHAIVDQVTATPTEEPGPDRNTNVIDRLTGKNRNPDPPPTNIGSTPNGNRQNPTRPPTPPATPVGPAAEDDPLRGL